MPPTTRSKKQESKKELQPKEEVKTKNRLKENDDCDCALCKYFRSLGGFSVIDLQSNQTFQQNHKSILNNSVFLLVSQSLMSEIKNLVQNIDHNERDEMLMYGFSTTEITSDEWNNIVKLTNITSERDALIRKMRKTRTQSFPFKEQELDRLSEYPLRDCVINRLFEKNGNIPDAYCFIDIALSQWPVLEFLIDVMADPEDMDEKPAKRTKRNHEVVLLFSENHQPRAIKWSTTK